MSYQSEAELERQLINWLSSTNYERVTINNEETLNLNFRTQLFNHNHEKLSEVPFTDKEFDRILTHIEGKSVFQSSKILRDKFILERDDGTNVYIEFMNTHQWCQNKFQVTNQTTMMVKYVNRYDVTIIINGLPLVQVELKRRGLDMKEAFNQIQRYRKHSYSGLFRYIQIFIISNGVDTKYFANADKEINYAYAFFWNDEKNNRITTLAEFSMTFLECCHIAKMISRYMVINDSERSLMVMRSYQVHAVEAMVYRALETNNNGYIWHTTGSGKTLTSFKASQIIAAEPSVKKVFFLVDRKDLDTQTIQEFNKFESGSVDTTNRTDVLVRQIKDINRTLIVTTIQKLSNATNSLRYMSDMEKYKTEKVVFVIDECHRSQFGHMHRDIARHFQNAQYFGFTGTPRFIENKSQDDRTTADLFDKCLHTYLIKNAINDGNVLGFSVEYIKTVNGEFDSDDDTLVKAIDTDEVWMSDKRINMIAEHIVQHHNAKSRDGQYGALFTVQSIPMILKYYAAFKSQNTKLKISAIFTFGANEDSEGKDEHSRDSLEHIITDYNHIYGTGYSTDKFDGYFRDISKRLKTAQLDILIVVNMFLTGFDSKPLKILYVDKNLKYHDLLQAFSRTNRVEKSTKPFGNIVCYRNLKSNTDTAIKLFSQTNDIDTVIQGSFDDYLNAFKVSLKDLYSFSLTPDDVDKLQSEDEKKKFILIFRELTRLLVKLQSFTKFVFEESLLGITQQKYMDFKSKYFLIYDIVKRGEVEKTSILSDIDFGIELMQTDKINVSYIMNLIRNIDLSNIKKRQNDIDKINKEIDKINKEIDRADNESLRLKVDLIGSFLDKVVPNLTEANSVDDAYNEFENTERIKEIEEFSNSIGIDISIIKAEVSEYEYSGILREDVISDMIRKPLLEKISITKKIINFIIAHIKKFE
ncbi:MAG: type I restriction endonuclease subunit R [Oscillospiraceae bacterium]|nr:type I restriction endonuclease subunit R [Oscillospiraceae bacterium]